MLKEQLVRQWNAVHEGYAADVDAELIALSHRLHRQGVLADPYLIPGDEQPPSHGGEIRRRVLRGLAAVLITALLFAGAIGALVAPTPALAIPAHMILQ